MELDVQREANSFPALVVPVVVVTLLMESLRKSKRFQCWWWM
jgi:hypothetical protein